MRNSKLRVLVVDDEEEICRLIEDDLDDQGYEVLTANNDAAAYAVLDRGGVDALITDINLGRGTTGFDVARHARRLNPELPVVYVTGGALHGIAMHAVENSALAPKPFDLDRLRHALREKLGLTVCARQARRGGGDDASV